MISGFAVDALIVAVFGLGSDTDAFYVAFVLVNMVTAFAHVSCQWALIPLFSRRLWQSDKADAWRLFSILLNVGFLLLSCGALANLAVAPALIGLLAPGLDATTQLVASHLSVILSLAIVLAPIAELTKALLYARRFFAVASAQKVIANTVIIASILALAGSHRIAAVAEAYVLGQVSSLVVLGIALFARAGFKYHFSVDVRHPGVREAGRLVLVPTSSALVREGYLIAEKTLGSFLPAGSITALAYGRKIVIALSEVFLGSISTALLPRLSAALKANRASAGRMLRDAFKLGSMLSFSIGTGCMVLSLPLVRLLFERGRFSYETSLATASILAVYCIYLACYGNHIVMTTYFYAASKAKALVCVAVSLGFCTVALDIMLVPYLQAPGLAVGHSCALAISTVVGCVLLARDFAALRWRQLVAFNAKVVCAAAAMGLVMHELQNGLRQALPWAGTLSELMILLPTVVCGGIVFAVAAVSLRIEEIRIALGLVGTRMSIIASQWRASLSKR
jgi:putative peptidoglycan lipid II flippase